MRHLLHTTLLAAALLLAAHATALAKSEMQFRVLLGGAPGVEEFERDGPGGSTTFDLGDEQGGSLDLQLVLRTNIEEPVGFLGGVGFFLRRHTGEDAGGEEIELSVFGVHASPGVSFNLSPAAALEFKADLGLGAARQEVPGFEDGSGPYVSVGVAGGASVKLTETLLLCAEVGWLTFASAGEADFGFASVDTEFRGEGLMVNVGMGVAF